MSTTTTTRTQHTPGPWRYSRGLSGEAFQNSAVPIYAGRTFGGTVCEVIPHPSGEHHANAALIAAAPELLAALQDILADAQRVKLAYFTQAARAEVEARFARARAAIAKAEGAL